VNPEVLLIAQQMAEEMSANGAVATVLMGSHVRGEEHSGSDVDLTFIGRDEDGWLERHGSHLVSVYWRSEDSVASGFSNPAVAGGLVPAWRQALVIHDLHGIATRLKQQAESWEWDSISSECDRWVAEQISSYAEEVHRLVGCLGLGNKLMAAVVRSVLATRLAMVLAVHQRLFYDTESKLWDLVGRRAGDRWTALQAKALGIGGEPFQTTCEASLELYALAVVQTKHLFNEIQHRVVEHACSVAGHRIKL
jgi:hypothetical protein